MQQTQQSRKENSFFALPSKSYFLQSQPQRSNSETSQIQNLQLSKDEESMSSGRLAALHSKLEQEASKIRKWKLQTEYELKVKEQSIIDGKQTIESLRKSSLELQLENENLSQKLQEEMVNREEILFRINATREMCELLKSCEAKLDDSLQKCETERTELKYKEKEHRKNLEDLTKEFESLEIATAENYRSVGLKIDMEHNNNLQLKQEFEKNLMSAEEKINDLDEVLRNKEEINRNISELLQTESSLKEKLEKENLRLEYVLSEKMDALKNLTMEQSKISDDLHNCKDENKALEGELVAVKTELEDAQKMKQHMQCTFNEEEAEFKENIAKLEKTNIELIEQQKRNNERTDELESLLHESKSKAEATEKEIENLKIELVEAKEEIYKVEKFKELALENTDVLNKQLDIANQENIKSKEDIEKLKDKLSATESNIESANKEITELMEQITLKDKTLGDNIYKLDMKQEAYKQIQAEVQEYKDKTVALKEENERLLNEFKKESVDYQTLLKEKENIFAEKELACSESTAAHKELKKVQKQLEKSTNKEKDDAKKIEELKLELQDVKNSLKNMQEKIEEDGENSVKELINEQKKVKDLEKKLAEKSDGISKEKSKNEKIKSDLASKNKEMKELEKNIKAMKKEADNKSKAFTLIEQESDALKADMELKVEKIECFKKENESLNSELEQKMSEINDLQKQVDELQSQFKEAKKEKESISSKCEYDLKRMANLLDRNESVNEKLFKKKDQEIEDLLSKIKSHNELETEVKELREELTKSENKVIQLEKKTSVSLDGCEAEKKMLEDAINKQQEIVSEKDRHIYELEKTIAEEKEKLLMIKNQLESEKNKNQAIQDGSNQILQENYLKLEKENKAFCEEVKELRSQILRIKSKENCKMDVQTSFYPSTPKTPRTPSFKAITPSRPGKVNNTPCQLPMEFDVSSMTTPKNNNGILKKTGNTSINKKRRSVNFVQNENSESESVTSDAMQVELDEDLNVKLVSMCKGAKISTKSPLTPKYSATVKNRCGSSDTNIKKAKTHSDNHSEIEQFKQLFPNYKDNPKTSSQARVKKTPSRSGGKYFKDSPVQRKKSIKSKNSKSDGTNWFDNDAVFGFGPED